MSNVLSSKLKHEVSREPYKISFHGLDKRASRHPVQISKIRI